VKNPINCSSEWAIVERNRYDRNTQMYTELYGLTALHSKSNVSYSPPGLASLV